jgi:hypothetical protein
MEYYYTYAICAQADLALPSITGIGDTELAFIEQADLAAVVSSLEASDVPLTRANLLRHEAVIEALMAVQTVLPVRFGTVGSAERVRESLVRGTAVYREDLVRLAGKVEISLRVMRRETEPATLDPSARSKPTDGRSYLMARLSEAQREERERAAVTERVHVLTAGLRDLAEAVDQTLLPTSQTLLKAAYLIDRTQLQAVRECIRQMRGAQRDLTFLATGPWPAYSFVRAPDNIKREESG